MSMFRHLGLTLKVLRELRGLPQAKLARAAGVGKSQLSKYERGQELPKLGSLERLLQSLGLSPLAFFEMLHLLDGEAAKLTGSPGAAKDRLGAQGGRGFVSEDVEASFQDILSALLKLHRAVLTDVLRGARPAGKRTEKRPAPAQCREHGEEDG